MVASVRPARPAGHGSAWQQLTEHREQISRVGRAGPDRGEDRRSCWAGGAWMCRTARCTGSVWQCCGFGPQGRDGAGGRRRAGGRVPARLRQRGPAARPGDRPATSGARVDFHRRVLAAHVRVAELLADARGGDRRLRGGMGRSSAACSRSLSRTTCRAVVADADPVNPRLHQRLAGLRPALRVRHRRRAGPHARRTSPGWNGRSSTFGRNFLAGETFVDLPTRRPGSRRDWCAAGGRATRPRHHPGPPGRGVRRARRRACCCPCRRPTTCRCSSPARFTATSTSRSARRSTRSRRAYIGQSGRCPRRLGVW